MSLNVFVTGGSGYIGSALCRMLSTLPYITGIKNYDIRESIEDNIINLTRLTQSMIEFKPYIVVHLAAVSSITACNENVEEAIRINGIGTRNVLRAMEMSGCKHIIYASTSSVYGKSTKLPYKEKDIIKPYSAYGLSKLLGEHAMFNEYQKRKGGSYLIYRMFNVVGTSGFEDIDKKSHPGYDRLFGALESGNITIYGSDYLTRDGTCERDYIALKDVCEAYIRGIQYIKYGFRIREIFNICTETPVSVKTMIEEWNKVNTSIGRKVNTKTGERREGDPAIVYGSGKKAQKLIYWKATIKVSDIIKDIQKDKKWIPTSTSLI